MSLGRPCWIVRKFRGRSAGQRKFFRLVAIRQLIAIHQHEKSAPLVCGHQQEFYRPHQGLSRRLELTVSQRSSHAALFAIPRLQPQTVFAAIAKSAQSKTVAHNK